MKTGGRRNIIFLILMIFMSMTVIVAGSEIIARVFLRDKVEPHQGCPLDEPDCEKRYIKRNLDGFRDHEHDLKKESGVYRIAVLGDSYSFGFRIENVNYRYSEILENKLNEYLKNHAVGSIKRFEIFNFAVPGSSTTKQVETYDKYVRKYHPDLVIMGVLFNDIKREKTSPLTSNPPAFFVEILKRSYIARFLYLKYLVHEFNGQKWYDSYFQKIWLSYSDQRTLDLYSSAMVSFKEKCRRDNSDFFVALFPAFVDFTNYPLDRERLIMLDIFKAGDIHVVDLFPYFKGKNVMAYRVKPFDAHPNADAQLIFAEALFSELVNNGIFR